jgi:hypothetical protein
VWVVWGLRVDSVGGVGAAGAPKKQMEGVDIEFTVAGRTMWWGAQGNGKWAPAGGGGACLMIDGGNLRRCQLLMLSGALGTPLAPCMIFLPGGVSD